MVFPGDMDGLRELMFSGESKTELWHILLLVFLGILIVEVLMTRRLVRGGHVATGEDVDGVGGTPAVPDKAA